MQPDGVDDAVELPLAQSGGGQLQLLDFSHQIAKNAALTATRGHHFFSGSGFDIRDALAGFDGGSPNLPIHRDRLDFLRRLHQALVAQKTQHQQFRLGAQGHERDQLALVDINRERSFGRDGDRAGLAEFIDSAHLLHQWCTGASEPGQGAQDFLAGAAAAAGAGAPAGAAAALT